MKLIKCPDCDDMVAMRPWTKQCQCGRCKGKYQDNGITLEVQGKPMVYGVNNSDFFSIPYPSDSVKETEL